jgi:hypothetical protein
MRLMTEVGPMPRRAGRYWGNCAAAGVAEGEPPGRDGTGVAEGDLAGLDEAGVAEGFTCTCTSAAKRVVPASRAAAVNDQNLGMTAYATQCSRFRKVNSRHPTPELDSRRNIDLLTAQR